MFKKMTAVTLGILFLLSTSGFAAAGQGKGSGNSNNRQATSQTRNQFQKQVQVDKNCDGSQIKTQTRKRTNYIK